MEDDHGALSRADGDHRTASVQARRVKRHGHIYRVRVDNWRGLYRDGERNARTDGGIANLKALRANFTASSSFFDWARYILSKRGLLERNGEQDCYKIVITPHTYNRFFLSSSLIPLTKRRNAT